MTERRPLRNGCERGEGNTTGCLGCERGGSHMWDSAGVVCYVLSEEVMVEVDPSWVCRGRGMAPLKFMAQLIECLLFIWTLL